MTAVQLPVSLSVRVAWQCLRAVKGLLYLFLHLYEYRALKSTPPPPLPIMFANTLTRDIGLKVGPTMFQVLVQHYFDHLKLDVEKSDCLKQEDVLYHEAFTVVKVSYVFLGQSLFDLFKGLFKCFNTVSNNLYLLSINNPSMQPYD